MNIYQVIKTIKKTSLMNESEKDAAIAEIHKCKELQESKKNCNDVCKSFSQI